MTRVQDGGRNAKRDAVLLAAQDIFLSEGFEAASMGAIARTADVSKQTVYNHFGSKKDLFHAVVQRRCSLMATELDRGFLQYGDDVEQALIAYGQNILDVMLSRQSMQMRQLVQSESGRYPELAEIFYRLGPDTITKRLAHYFSEQNRKGVLSVAQPRMAAEQFISMLPGHLRIRHLIGLGPAPGHVERRRWAANAVELFLNGTRPD